MLQLNFVPFPTLETERLVLRKPVLSDADELFIYRSDIEYMRYIPHRLAATKEEVIQSLNMMEEKIEKHEGINWAITLKGDDKIIGVVGYVKFFHDHYRAEIGYMLTTPHHGTGIIKEATDAVIKYGFETMNLHSIEAIINHENMSSKRLAEKLGFTNDAFFKDYLYHGGKFVSANVYSLVKD